jgi:adenylate cyclase class IV
MGGARRNLELKVRDADPKRSLRACEHLRAEDRGALSQKDTYFDVPRGRLKLRREVGAPAHLIAYERPDLPGQGRVAIESSRQVTPRSWRRRSRAPLGSPP